MRLPPKISYLRPALEGMPRDEFEALQFEKLKYQLDYVYHNNEFYRRKFQEAKMTPEDIATREDFVRKVPTVCKEDFIKDQTEHPPFGLRLGVPLDKVSLIWQSGGTSGKGVEVYGQTRADIEVTATNSAFGGLYWAGLRKGDVAVSFLPVGLTAGGWTGALGYRALGAAGLFLAPYSTEVRIGAMRRFGVNLIETVPSYLSRLTEACLLQGINPRVEFQGLKAICLTAELGLIALTEKMEETWGTRLHDRFGCTQGAAVVAGTCEKGAIPEGKRGAKHIYEWSVFAEVIDPETGEHVKPGDRGELVLTTLEKEASPTIRYRMADQVTFFTHDYCDCGRPFNFLEPGTVGRYDDTLKIKASSVRPIDVDEILFAREEIDEYAARVSINNEGNTDVLLQVGLKPEVSLRPANWKDTMFAELVNQIRLKTNVTMRIQEVPLESLKKWEWKPRRWTDERQEGLRAHGEKGLDVSLEAKSG